MKWEDYKAEFEFEAEGMDIYVLEISVSDWQILLDFICSGAYEYQCLVDYEESALPANAEKMLDHDGGSHLFLKVGPATLGCHFFAGNDIEFDFNPREVTNEFEANQIFDFMRQLGDLLNKDVILTHESAQHLIIFQYLRSVGEIEYIPPSYTANGSL